MTKLIVDEYARNLCNALGIEANDTKRIIIDVSAGSIPMVYIEQYLDSRKIQVLPTLDGVKVQYVDKEAVNG